MVVVGSGGPLILLSPAKTLNFDAALSSVLAKMTPTRPRMPAQTSELAAELAKLGKPQIKSLMGLSDNLAALNHERFSNFDAQPSRMAIGAFEGMAYKGLDAPSLDAPALDYLQSNLRILCGLYGVLRPYDEIRPYRLEMSTKLGVGAHANLYKYWGSALTDSLDGESPSWVLNVASQEYAKSVQFASLRCPVVTAQFPGPAVHAKNARGEMARFCAQTRLTNPEQLRDFTGSGWSYVPSASDASTYVFHRGGAKASTSKAAKPTAAAKRKEADEDDESAAAAPPSPGATAGKSRRRKTS